MVNERFSIEISYNKIGLPQGYYLKDNVTGRERFSLEEFCRLVNQLLDYECRMHEKYKRECLAVQEEIEALTDENHKLVNDTANVIAEHTKKILDLIDEKIAKAEKEYNMTYDNELYGEMISLKELKKELQHD